jgi:glycosyltransferase involved in cell wall biosynthesis
LERGGQASGREKHECRIRRRDQRSGQSGFLGNALALLIDWPEPFGLVMIEAMACGTPVIAFRRGSVPEIVEHGVSGFIVDDVDGAVEAVAQIDALPRAEVRRCMFLPRK